MTDRCRATFNYLDELRIRARLAQEDVASLVGTTRRAYIVWCQGGPIKEHRLSRLNYAVFLLEHGLHVKQLPITGHDRRPGTAERRRETVEALKAQYPFSPVD